IASPPRPPRTHPAVLVNWIGDVIAYADGYERYARPHRVPRTGPRGPRAGLSPRHGASIHEPRVAALVDELTVTAGAPVADRLAAVPSLPRRTGVDVVAHPEAGTLRLAYETPAMPEADSQRLVVNG
ncbi:transcriptional regulator, partial [Streptomyces aureus]